MEEFLTEEFYAKEFYDITGLSAIQVIAVLTDIINDPEKWNDSEVFYFVIKTGKKSATDERLFKLMAKPTERQPGNGFVRVLGYDSQSKSWLNRGRKYIDILASGDLKLRSKTFAEVIQTLFKDNSGIAAKDLVIAEVYFLVLFEIARRLSDGKKGKSKIRKAQELDELPVGIAIVRQIRKMAAESEDTSMALETIKPLFDCFVGECGEREVAIRKVIGNGVSEISSKKIDENNQRTDRNVLWT